MIEENYPNCDECGSSNVSKFVYGLPDRFADVEVDNKRIIRGGCMVHAESPKWKCRDCGHTWGREISPEDMD